MASQIEQDDTQFSARTMPWHGMAKVSDKALNMKEALIYSGLDWKVEKRPLFFPGSGGIYHDSLEAFGIVRVTDEKLLGVHGEGYNPIQNEESFEFCETLLQEGATYETAGSLFGGKRIFITANLRSIDILGDSVNEYLVLANSHDGSMPMTGMITPIRVVCNNTLRMAISEAKRIVKIRHTKNAVDRIDLARQILGLAHKYTDKIRENAEKMFTIEFNGNKLDNFIDKVFGYDEKDETVSSRMKNQIDSQRDQFVECLQAPDLENFGGTAWGVFQALSDFDSHRPVPRDSQNSKDRNFLRIIDGNNDWLEQKTKLMLEMAE
jgi:phage/plasmid-like protein (TIGR03299 family)